MQEYGLQEGKFSLKSLFVPFTTSKAIHFIILIGIIVFANMLFNGFVWDDNTYIVFNPQIHIFNILASFESNFFNTAGQYRPLPVLYFSLLYSLFQDTTFYYHAIQLLLHIVNTILLLLFFTRYFQKKLSFILSLLFLVHPIQIESVSYIAAADSPLFFLFGMSALLLSFKEHITQRRLFLISFLLLLSVLSKETGFLFLPIILLQRSLLQTKFQSKQLLTLFTYEFATAIIYFIIRFAIGLTGIGFVPSARIPINRLSLIERLIKIPEIIWYYVKTFIFPKDLVIEQNWIITKIDFAHFYLPLSIDILFFLALIVFALSLWKKQQKMKLFGFFFFWFIIGLFLHLQLYPLDMTVADRWFYFPIIGLLGIIGVFLTEIKPTKNFLSIGYALVSLLLLLLSIRTIVRNANWTNPITLYTHDLKIYDNYDLESTLGVEYEQMHQYPKAIEASKKAVALLPYEATYYNLANTYEEVGNKKMAKAYYTKAIHSDPYLPIGHKHFAVTYVRLAYLLYLGDNLKKAEEVAQNGVQDYPTQPYLWSELAACEYKLGDQSKALASAEKAKTFLPNSQMNTLYNQIQNHQAINLKM